MLIIIKSPRFARRSIDFVKHNSEPIPEAFLDLVMTVAAALKNKTQTYAKSIYVVKPKLHGAEEVAFTVKVSERNEPHTYMHTYIHTDRRHIHYED